MDSVANIVDKYNYCRKCGKRIGKSAGKACSVCAEKYKEEFMLTIDVGTYHVEINTAVCTDAQISKIITAACKKAKQMKKEAKKSSNKVT